MCFFYAPNGFILTLTQKFEMKIFLATFCLICSLPLLSQVEKGRYLFGGSASASVSLNNSKQLPSAPSSFEFGLSPRAGKFVKDQLALGLTVDLGRQVQTNTSSFNVGIGPFARYYFFESGRELNVLAGGGFELGTVSTNLGFRQDYYNIRLSSGPVYFIEPNIGLELLLNYSLNKIGQASRNLLFMSFGFQWHFGLPKN